MKAHLSRIIVAALVISPLLATEPILAQESPAVSQESAPLTAQLQRLNQNIERIAKILEQSLQGQNLELLIQRVEMGSSRLAVAEGNLRSARATRNSLDDEKLEIEARLDQMADELDRGGLQMPLEDLERYTREMDLQLQLLKQRLREADREILELENEVTRQRANIRDWQDFIDQELTARQ